MTIDLTKPLALFLAVAVVGFFVGGFMLSGGVEYTACLDHPGVRRGRTVRGLLCSPRLLDGSWQNIFKFVWLWTLPALLVAPPLYRLIRKPVS